MGKINFYKTYTHIKHKYLDTNLKQTLGQHFQLQCEYFIRLCYNEEVTNYVYVNLTSLNISLWKRNPGRRLKIIQTNPSNNVK